MSNKKYIGFKEQNTVEIEIDGKKCRVFKGEADMIKKNVAAREKKNSKTSK